MQLPHLRALLGLAFLLPTLALAALPRESRVPGGVAIVPLADARAPRPQARFRGQPVLVAKEHGRWLAVVGLPLDLEPGTHALELEEGSRSLPIEVDPKQYAEQHLTIKDQGKVDLSPENEARVAVEHAEIRDLKTRWRETADVDLGFGLPAKGKLSGRFGLRRVFNGQPRAPHAGFDIAAPRGTPVVADAAGQVAAVADYFFNGKTVFIDHGRGLISMFCHLERIDVKTGDVLERGQPIGTVGTTGRSTGPHLHWSVILNGAMVDPELFVPRR